MQVAGVALHGRTEANTDARLVHHMKHACQTLVRLANQIADGAGFALRGEFAFAKIEQSIGGAAITHFVIQPGERDIVAFAQLSIGIDQKFWHDEK